MNVTDRFEDKLEPVGIAAGVLLVLVGLATVAGQPWATKGSLPVALVQVVAALATAAIGAGLVWLSRTTNDSIAQN
ncbi:MAG: hypothetical protein ABEI98_07220 [Halorhabdus sp.]